MELSDLRKEIDRIDREIVTLLNDRIRLASDVGRLKEESGKSIYDPAREEDVFTALAKLNEGPLTDRALRLIYREIISAMISLEKKIVVAFLGPEATYTQQAAVKNFGSSVQYQALGTIGDVFSAVERGEADYGVVPIENSTEGSVEEAIDTLVDTDLRIVAQIHLEISLCLISHSGFKEIASVHSKDNALGQCRQWLGRMLPHADRVKMDSTARAVQFAAENRTAAAIASKLAADIYEVPIVGEKIQDKTDNFTRFLVMGKTDSGRLGEGRDKSSFVISLKDEAGALQRALEPFSKRGINLCMIESRPSRRKLWDYFFFIDLEGHYEDSNVRKAVDELESSCSMVKWLGSYPNTKI
jgi:chorismate mutase/prephenate dehydratase